jgi:hypothetical protein
MSSNGAFRAVVRARPGRPLAEERWLEPHFVVPALVVTQWLAVAGFAMTVQRNGWLFYQGGDQTWFYTSGWVLAHGHIPETFVGWVWPLAMLPLAALFGPNFLQAVPAVVLLQFALLLPLGLLAIYGIASRIGGRAIGYWAAAWWIVVPFAVIQLFVDRYHDTYVEQALPQAFGLTGLGDFPSMVVVLVSAYAVVRSLETSEPYVAVVAGLVGGIAIGIKPANGLFVVAPIVAYALARRWKAALTFCGALLPSLIVLALWKHKGSGVALLALEPVHLAADDVDLTFRSPTFWERVQQYVPLDREQLNHQFLGFREYFWSARLLEFIPLAGLVAVARRSIPIAGLLATWLAAFFIVKGSSTAVNVETGSIWRLLMPAWPAYFLLGAALPLLIPRLGRRLAAPPDAPPVHRTRWRNAAMILVAATALAGFGFLALPQDDTARAAKIPNRSLFLPLDSSFRIGGEAVGDGTIRLTWPKPKTAGVDPFYIVLRSPTEYTFPATDDVVRQGLRCHDDRGAVRCTIEMDEAGRSVPRTFRDRPPAGSWTYRVGVAANWLNDPEGGDILVLSEPLNVVVG